MTSTVEHRLSIARGLQLAGRTQPAIAAYDDVLVLAPEYHVARREIGLLSMVVGDDERAISELVTYTRECPIDMKGHHALIGALMRRSGADGPRAHYGLTELGEQPLPESGVCAMLVVRDEVDRLEFTLDYHRTLGVDAFAVIDNASSDGTLELLLARGDVHAWTTDAGYRAGCAGYAWVDAVLHSTGRRGWWMFLDADELFTYPPGDALLLPDLCRALEAEGADALPAILVDCYPHGRLATSRPAAGVDPRTLPVFFDRDWRQGARQRTFPVDERYLLTKVPLVRWEPGLVIAPGAHAVNGVTLSRRRAGLLHFKLVAGMAERSRAEVARHDVIVDSHQSAYVARFSDDPDLRVFDPTLSISYLGPEQLVELGVIR